MRVLKVVKDSVIYDGKIIKTGESFNHNEDVVAKELVANGICEYADVVEESVGVGIVGEHESAHLDPEDLDSMTYQNLKKLAKDMGLNANGTKEELIARISAVEVEIDEDEELPMTSMPE